MPIGGQSNLDVNQNAMELPQCPRRPRDLPVREPLLGEWQWACRNGECIAKYDTCDGVTQCSDGSDEWNCGSWDRMKQDHGFRSDSAVTQPKPPAVTSPTTTLAPDSSYVVLSARQIYFTFFVFVLLALAIVWVMRRRARQKALMRNRRGNILSKFQAQDSDEDDILISSMYS